MMARCYEDYDEHTYANYGGRGITVCRDWHHPESFITWAQVEGWYEGCGLQLDRRDNDKGYSPENCRWVTRSINGVNRRMQSNNTSGYVGVSWNKRNHIWEVKIKHQGRNLHVGRFIDVDDAVRARNAYIKKHKLPHKIQEVK